MAQARAMTDPGAVTTVPRPRPVPGALLGTHWRLPAGRELHQADFAWRHRVVRVLVAAHLPVLFLLGLLGTQHPAGALLGLVPVFVLLFVATQPSRRWLRSCAATLALLACSAELVDLFPDQPVLQCHVFVALAVVALYQDWACYAVAVVFVAVQQALVGADAAWALGLTGFVLAEAAVLVVFWHASEASRVEHDHMRDALLDGQSSVRARLEETDRIRTDLIGTVSHEFRTPLTGIRGAALTLLKRGDRLDAAARTTLLHAVLDQQERLSRLLENMLTAAQATATDPTAATEVDAVAAEVAMLAGAARPESPPVSLLVEQGTTAHIDRQALHQVLANLIDNAQQHGAPGAVPLLACGRDERGVWLTVSNEGTTLDSETARRLFEPFTQADSGITRQREGLGLGLYVVRRLVEVYGGSVALRSESGWTTVELRLAEPLPCLGERVAV